MLSAFRGKHLMCTLSSFLKANPQLRSDHFISWAQSLHFKLIDFQNPKSKPRGKHGKNAISSRDRNPG